MVKNWAEFLKNSFRTNSEDLYKVGNLVLLLSNLKPTDILLDIGTGLGFLGFKAYETLKEKGKVIAIDNNDDCISECKKHARENCIDKNYELLRTDILDNSLPDNCVNVIVSRSVIMHIKDKQAVFNELYRLLSARGRISLFEPIFYTKTERIYKLLDPEKTTNFKKIKDIEEKVRNDQDDALTNFDHKSLKENLKKAGFKNVKIFIERDYGIFRSTSDSTEEYFLRDKLPVHISLKNKFLKYMPEEEFNLFFEEVKCQLHNRLVYQYSDICYITAFKKPSGYDKFGSFIKRIKYEIFFSWIRFKTEISFYFKWIKYNFYSKLKGF